MRRGVRRWRRVLADLSIVPSSADASGAHVAACEKTLRATPGLQEVDVYAAGP